MCRAQQTQIDAALDIMVDEVFGKYSSNQEELTFEEWSQWFMGLEGMKDLLDPESQLNMSISSPDRKKKRSYLGGMNE